MLLQKTHFNKLLVTALLLHSGISNAQSHQKKRALFIGNSYTNVNDLPQMIATAALSAGDTLVFDSNTPGGQTFQQHSSNTITRAKIAAGNWDFVVLQEQSQFPSFPDAQVANSVFPYARKLDSLVNAQNPCAETVFYMTWGRKNGDAQNCGGWPPVCTYEGMDNLLQQRYTQMANDNHALLSPVAKVWRAIRTQYPTLELYQTDESHPSLAGSYAAACTFYSILFRENPLEITWNSALNATDAANIRNIVKSIVFDQLADFNVGAFDPLAGFTSTRNGQTVNFSNTSERATTYQWDFGDGNSSSLENPVHTYTGAGPFQVTLTASRCASRNILIRSVSLGTTGIKEINNENIHLFPNPAHEQVQIKGNNSLQGMTVYILQTDGKEIYRQKIEKDIQTISIETVSIPGGMYFMTIRSKDGSITYAQKLMVKH